MKPFLMFYLVSIIIYIFQISKVKSIKSFLNLKSTKKSASELTSLTETITSLKSLILSSNFDTIKTNQRFNIFPEVKFLKDESFNCTKSNKPIFEQWVSFYTYSNDNTGNKGHYNFTVNPEQQLKDCKTKSLFEQETNVNSKDENLNENSFYFILTHRYLVFMTSTNVN